MSRFLECLAKVLEAETGYKQPVGGPYVRVRPGHRNPLEDGKPDGMAYDDDPHDTGGRTCMGLLQREYDAYRTHAGEPHQDVWHIADAEVNLIYQIQYWNALGCDALPAGVDLATFDSGVNCGVGMGARFLQRALGVKDDGHIGMGTLAAVKDADPHDLVPKIIAAREQYHRVCKTAKYHLKGWLERDAATEHECVAMLGVEPVTEAPTYSFAECSVRATPPAPAESVADTATGISSVATGSTAGGLSLVGGVTLYSQAQDAGLLQPKNLVPFAIILASVAIVALARRDWIDRGKKLILGV